MRRVRNRNDDPARGSGLDRPGHRRRPAVKGDRVHHTLKRAIIRGELLPGTALDKAALCERFGVSRLSVTTAIHRLAYEGLILIEPQKGSYISRIRLEDVVQWMTARRAIEAEVAAEAARRLGPEARAAMQRNLRYQQAAIEAQDYDGFFELDVGFHHLLTDGFGAAPDHRAPGRASNPPGPRPPAASAGTRPHADDAGGAPRNPGGDRAARAGLSERAMRHHLDVVVDRLIDFERDHRDFFVP